VLKDSLERSGSRQVPLSEARQLISLCCFSQAAVPSNRPPLLQILTQPINALAFLADGILYGVGGFGYAAAAMFLACIPAGGVMLLYSHLAAGSAAVLDAQLKAVWAGLAVLMALRFLTIWLPLVLRRWPFDRLEA